MSNARIKVGPITYLVQPAVAEELQNLRAMVLTLAIAAACLSQPRHSVRKALAQHWQAYTDLINRPETEEERWDRMAAP